jgi:hypothetical protein
MIATPFRLAAFYSIFAGAITLALYLIRAPLGGPGGFVFLFYWLQVTALMGAATPTLHFGGSRYLIPFIATLLLFLTAGLLPSLSPLVALAAAGMAIWVFARTLGQRDIIISNFILLAALPLAAIYFLQLNSMTYDSVFQPEMVLSGTSFPDTLFHTALSSILVWYGRIASALDGFAPFRYHIFSHLWFGLASKAAGVNVINGYFIGMQILALPLMLFGLSLGTLASMPTSRQMPGVTLLIVVPLGLLCAVELYDWMSYLESESYAVGLLLLLIGLPFLRAMVDRDTHTPAQVIIALGYGLLLTTTKISIGALWTASVLYAFARSPALSKGAWAAAAAILLLDLYVVLNFTLPNDNVSSTAFEPFHFIRTYTTVALNNLLPITLAAIGHIIEWRRDHDRRWNEVSILMLALTVLPTLLLRIEGGSAYYFLNIGTWLAIASLAARIVTWANSRYALGVAVIAVVWIAVGTMLHPEKSIAYQRLKQQRDALLIHLDPSAEATLSGRGLFDREALKGLAAATAQSVGAQIGRQFDEMHVTAGSRAVVAVTPEFRSYWTLTKQCNAAPFLIPSFYGLPLLKGLPPPNEGCVLGSYYGYSLYAASSRATEIEDNELCRLARDKGFDTLIVLRSKHDGRRIECAGQ